MVIVDRIRTPSFEAQIRPELGRHFSGNRLAFAMAQTYIETAGWKSLYNNNAGNITAAENYAGFAFRPPWYELSFDASSRDVSLHQAMLEGRAPSAFRSYETLAAGVDDYAAQLLRRFPDILRAADTGDANLVARAIVSSGYCPDCTAPAFADNLGELATRFGARRRTGGGVVALLLGGATAAGVGFWLWRKRAAR